MRKILLIIFTSLLLLTGCNSNEVASTIKLREKILTLYGNTNYKKSGLSSKEKKLIDNLIEEESDVNKEINVSKLIIKDDEHKVNEEDTKGIYKKGDEYYIKYSDIVFDTYDIETMSEYVSKQTATIVAGGYFVEVKKENIPLLNEVPEGSLIYDYYYINKKEDNNSIIYYYESYYDNTGMEMVFNKDNNEIKNIKLDYTTIVSIEPEEEEPSIGVEIGSEIFIVFALVGLLFIFLKIVKSAAFNAKQ